MFKCQGNCSKCGRCTNRAHKRSYLKSNRRRLMWRKARKMLGLPVESIYVYKLNRDIVLKRRNKYLGRYYKKFLKSRKYSSWGRGR